MNLSTRPAGAVARLGGPIFCLSRSIDVRGPLILSDYFHQNLVFEHSTTYLYRRPRHDASSPDDQMRYFFSSWLVGTMRQLPKHPGSVETDQVSGYEYQNLEADSMWATASARHSKDKSLLLGISSGRDMPATTSDTDRRSFDATANIHRKMPTPTRTHRAMA